MSNFMPHGHCYFWDPYILWSYALSDSIIALAYLSIPLSLFYIYWKRKDFIYSWMIVLFTIFFFGCSLTHIFDVVNIWHPFYEFDAAIRIVTAITAVTTAAILLRYAPMIINLPTLKEWKSLNEKLSKANTEFYAANEELQSSNEELNLLNEQLKKANEEIRRLSEKSLQQSQLRYKELADSISDVFFALDSSFCITYWNKASENQCGFKSEEALGKSLYDIYPNIKGTSVDRLYKSVMTEGKPDKITYYSGGAKGDRIMEINAYPSSDGLTVIAVDLTDLLQARSEAEEKKDKLELALWGSGSGCWEYDVDTETFSFDQHYAKIMQIDDNSLSSSLAEWQERIHPEDLPLVMEALHQLIDGTNISFQTHFRLSMPANNTKWVMSNAKMVTPDIDSKQKRVVGIAQDISEIKSTEEANRFFRYLIDHTNDPIYWIDPNQNFNFSYVNEAACRHFGMTAHELNNMSMPEWDPNFVETDLNGVWEDVRRVKSVAFESVHIDANQRRIPVEVTGNYLQYGDKEYIAGHIKDISERKAYQNKILELQKRFEGIIDSAMDAIITADDSYNILIFNKAAEKMFSYKAEDVIGQTLSVLIPKRFHGQHRQHLKNFATSKNYNRKMGNQLPIFGINSRGEEFPIEASISQTEVEDRQYFTIIMRDISLRVQREQQEKALNEELIRQNEQLQQFGYITSHNLRGPVATILGLTEIFDIDEIHDDESKTIFGNIRTTTEKMDEILRDFNQVLQYKSNINTRHEWIDLRNTTETVQIVLADAIKQADAIIDADLDVKQIFCNKSYVTSIFYNLISNAIKYQSSEKKPVIQIRSRQENDMICLEFEDNGIGIDLGKHKSKLFQMYKRFHPQADGKGLGLYIVKTQIEALNGSIGVRSSLGKGSTFKVCFPIQNQPLPNMLNQ